MTEPLNTDELRGLAGQLSKAKLGSLAKTAYSSQSVTELRAAADEIDRLRELVDILQSVPGSSIHQDKGE